VRAPVDPAAWFDAEADARSTGPRAHVTSARRRREEVIKGVIRLPG